MESRWVGFSGHRLFPPFVAPSAGREPSRLLRAAAVARTVFDSHDRPVRIWVGTNDTPASGTWSPTNNAGSSNMVKVSSTVYDNGGVGDSNITSTTQYPGNSQPTRSTINLYDWRDRLVSTKTGVITALPEHSPGSTLHTVDAADAAFK